MNPTATAPLSFEKIGAGIYRTRIGDIEVQARKVDDLWFMETRSFVAGGRFTVQGYERSLKAAKATAQRVAEKVTATAAPAAPSLIVGHDAGEHDDAQHGNAVSCAWCEH